MNNLHHFISHGDVNLYPISKKEYENLAKDATKTAHDGKFVLAYGETTGHKHLLTALPDMLEVLELPDGKGRIMRVSQPFPLTHEEHHRLEVQEDYYRQVPEREMNHFEGSAERKVQD